MISWINGDLVELWQTNQKFFILINCQGLGYEIQILESFFLKLKSNPGYVKSYEVDVEIPCGGQNQAENIDDNDCSEGSVIGGILGAGLALSSSRGKDRFWAVPAGGTAGALIGCQVDGG